MKNNITVYIALCGLLTAAGTTMAMENPLAITSPENPNHFPRNNTDQITTLNLINSPTDNPSISPNDSPKKNKYKESNSDDRLDPIDILTSSPRKTIENTSTEQITRRNSDSILETTQTQILSRSNSQLSLSTNSLPHPTSPITIPVKKLSASMDIPFFQSDSEESFHSTPQSPNSSPQLKRSISKKEITALLDILHNDSDKKFDSEKATNTTHTPTSTPEKETTNYIKENTQDLVISFKNTEPQGVIDCYQATHISLDWENKTLIITYLDSENGEKDIEIPVLKNNIPDEKYAYIKDTRSKTIFAIDLQLEKHQPSCRNHRINEPTTPKNNKPEKSINFPSHNGKSPVYTVIGVGTFVAVCIALAYRYNKLPDSCIQLLNSILPTRYAL